MPLLNGVGFVTAQAALFLLSLFSFLICIWTFLPPPVMAALPFAIGAAELSPLFLAVNVVLVVCCFAGWNGSRIARVALALAGMALLCNCWTAAQIPSTINRMDAAMQAAFGADYEARIPAEQRQRLRQSRISFIEMASGIKHASVREERGIIFAQPAGVPLRVNLFQPEAAGNYPAVVIIYGGGWSGGSPTQAEPFSRYLASRGYVVACIDYRHAPQFRYREQIADIHTALAYVQAHWQSDPKRIALLGRSAGAHLAMLAAYEPNAPKYAAVVDFYGPVDLKGGYEDPPVPDPLGVHGVLEAFLGGTPSQVPDAYRAASPLSYVSGAAPPTLILHGTKDHLVKVEFSRRLAAQLRAAGAPVALLETPWSEHAFDMIFSGVGDQLALYYIERFLALELR